MTPAGKEELRTLAEGYVAGELDDAQMEALEARLRSGEDVRLQFLAYLEVHAGLAWEFRGADFPMPQITESEPEPGKVVPLPIAMKTSLKVNTQFLRWMLPLAAAVVIFATIAGAWRKAHPRVEQAQAPAPAPAQTQAPVPAPVLATVKASRHGQWADGSEVAEGIALKAGTWEWQSGLVELQTNAGTVLLVEGPASLELKDAQHARLLSGSVVVRMPKGESGFVVEMPQMKVTDLGTEFGVSVSPDGESRVQVFDGKVRAESSSTRAGKELVAGQTLRSSQDGALVPVSFSQDRFIRRFPPARPGSEAGGVLYSKPALDSVMIAPAPAGVQIDGDLSEWDRAGAFRSSCLPPFDQTYFVEGMMMYDAQNLYLAAHVSDPEPMRNATRDNREFAGGSVIVRVSTDRALGWPLKGTTNDFLAHRKTGAPLPDSISDRVASIIMWFDAHTGKPGIRLQYGFDLHEPATPPAGWQGAFRQDPAGDGYTLEYAIPWSILNAANDPPQAGDVLAALWMVHWSDEEGRVCRGQLVDVTNHDPQAIGKLQPHIFFQNGPTWGRAIYLPAK